MSILRLHVSIKDSLVMAHTHMLVRLRPIPCTNMHLHISNTSKNNITKSISNDKLLLIGL